MAALARLIPPDDPGGVLFIKYDAPGTTTNPNEATRFANDRAAWRAANAAIWGDGAAFWPSERSYAAKVRATMGAMGWRADVLPVSE